MDAKIRFERQINENSGTLKVTIPKEMAEYLKLKDGDTLIWQPEQGKKGKYASTWKK